MLKYGLAYGLLSARRRAREMLLPSITIATGAFLVVIVFAMSAGIKKQAAGPATRTRSATRSCSSR